MAIDELVTIVARLTSYEKDELKKTGSGFFYTNTSGLHYITNRHMVIKEDENYHPDKISLRLHKDANNLQDNGDFLIELYDNGNPIWKEHPKYGSKVDVVGIPIDQDKIKGNFIIKAFAPQNHLPNDIEIEIGQELMVMGFPKGFSDDLYNLPIIRNANLASVYPVPFRGNPFVLIDSRLHGGTSGSPVITKVMNMVKKTDGSTAIMSGNPRYLIGIHSASIDIIGTKDTDPLGLNCTWFASLIDDITK